MQVYLIAAEADAEAAKELEAFLKRHGCIVRIALGQAMFHPARPHEMTVGLWSLKTRMSVHQITFTNRAIDALVEDRLVVGQLDFHPLPFGLSDVSPFDLRSPGMRNMRFQQMLAELRKSERARINAVAPSSPMPSSDLKELEADAQVDSAQGSALEAVDQRQTDVFVSYAYANKDIVWPLVDGIQTETTSIWIDKEELKPGTHWAGNIVRAIKSSHMFCLMCTSDSYASDNVRREVYLADKYEKPILPVLLDRALMPEDIEYFLIDRQWLDMTAIDPTSRPGALLDAIAV